LIGPSPPLEGDVFIGGLFGFVAWLNAAGAIKNSDRIGFELDNKLLNHVLDGFLSVCNGDSAVILPSYEFALNEDVGPLTARDSRVV
jgi:hypothetical protein